MIISMGDNGFSTSLSDQKCDFAHLHCSDYKTKRYGKNEEKWNFCKIYFNNDNEKSSNFFQIILIKRGIELQSCRN